VNGLTAGKRESGAPVYLAGGRVEWDVGPVLLGAQAKVTGPRYVNDQNIPIFNSGYTVYPAKTPAYTLVDLDARIKLDTFLPAIPPHTYIQLNVTNLFDKLYVGGFTGNTSSSSIPFAYIGAPRTFSAALNVEF
jgi:iron complex outermembrane receptor protein